VFTILVILAMLVALLPVGAAGAAEDGDDVEYWLTVLHNNDGESALLPSDVLDEEDEFIGFQGGVAYFATVRRDAARAAARSGAPGIFVSSGDNFLAGTSYSASIADGVWYDAMALDTLDYDAIVLGNHDFDFGPDVLASFISEGFRTPGDPPYLSANLDFSLEPNLQTLVDAGVIAASTTVTKDGEVIGIVGATTPVLRTISSPRDVIVNDVLPVVQDEVDALTNAGVDKIIFVSHLQDIEGDILLAAELHDVDVMVAAGGDELLADEDDLLLPNDSPDDIFGPYPIIATDADGNSVPIVTTSGQYGYLGQLVVGFDAQGNVVEIDEDRSGPRRVVSQHFRDGVRPFQGLNTGVVGPVSDFIADLAANIIGTSEVDLDGIRESVRSVETNEGNLIADSQRWQAAQLAGDFDVPEPDVALQNGGGVRNDDIIPAGDITELDTFDMVPFPNFVAVFPEITRDQFKEILENAVSRTQDGDIPGGTGRFAQVSGFEFTYSASGTAQVIDVDTGDITTPGTRIQDVTLNDGTALVAGGSVVAGDPISIAITDFLARGGDQYPFGDAEFTVLGVSYQQALSNYIQADTADDGLGGLISAADYPEGGEGRIVELP
jgi:5'-nucleotidase